MVFTLPKTEIRRDSIKSKTYVHRKKKTEQNPFKSNGECSQSPAMIGPSDAVLIGVATIWKPTCKEKNSVQQITNPREYDTKLTPMSKYQKSMKGEISIDLIL